MAQTLKDRTVSGLTWSATAQIAKQATNIVVSLLLARLTGPSAFGLLGMVTIFTGFASLFIDLGLGMGIVQRADLKEEHLSTVFWVNLASGIVLTLVLFESAPLVGRFYNEPAIDSVMRILSLGFVLSASGTVHNALLMREMRFADLAKVEVASTALSGITGILAALYGLGVWSLVIQTLLQMSIKTIGLWIFSDWRPRASAKVSGIRDLAHFSGHLFAFNILNYWIRNLDNLLVGRFLGNFALGLYSRAYQLMLLPVQQITGVSGNVLFPAMASVQHDLARLRNIYLRAISAIHLIAAPIYAGLFAVADTFVATILGREWLDVIPLLRILCIVGFFQPVGSSTGWIYQAVGRSDVMMKWGILTSVLYVSGFFVGLTWGLLGVTWSYCVAGLLAWYPGWTIAGRLVNLNFLEMLRPLIPASVCAAIMGGAVWIVGYLIKPLIHIELVFTSQVLAGCIIYFALIAGLKLDSWKHVRSLASRPPEPSLEGRLD